MRIALDTNCYRDFCAADPAAVDTVQRAERIFMPFVTLGELRAGFLAGLRAKENERILTEFLASRRVGVLLATSSTTRHYAQLFLQLRRQGTPIPTNDLWIAALVLEEDLHLFTRDAHFDHLPQLPRVA